VVLSSPLLTRDIVETVQAERITGLAAVPSQWIQLAALDWRGCERLRYLSNSSGILPAETVLALRARLPGAAIYLMHGSADACRSTYLAPDQAALRPGSIGKAVPGAEVLVLAPDGRRCAANEPGELVQRGELVPGGYWNEGAPEPAGQPALWSGDLVRMDDDGYLYYLGRGDTLIASGGHRISPREVEDVVRATGMAAELAVLGMPHPVLGHSVVLVARAQPGGELAGSVLQAACRAKLPPYMVPAQVQIWQSVLPRDGAGAIDRAALARTLEHGNNPANAIQATQAILPVSVPVPVPVKAAAITGALSPLLPTAIPAALAPAARSFQTHQADAVR
jgi:acyl-CoA synthetase (AMP-forming)/AMP-acid ligase II